MTPLNAAVGALFVLANVVAWAAFRLDKRAAAKRRRRIPERRLMTFAALGPFGALGAMYGHAKRHKVQKRLFALVPRNYLLLRSSLFVGIMLKNNLKEIGI